MHDQKPTATKVRDLTQFRGHAAHYRLSSPMDEASNVVVSALVAAFDTGRPETLIFAADEDGNVTSYLDLSGSQRGTTSHEVVLHDAGYEIVNA